MRKSSPARDFFALSPLFRPFCAKFSKCIYINNVKAGTAKFTAYGTGKFFGQVKGKFNIVANNSLDGGSGLAPSIPFPSQKETISANELKTTLSGNVVASTEFSSGTDVATIKVESDGSLKIESKKAGNGVYILKDANGVAIGEITVTVDKNGTITYTLTAYKPAITGITVSADKNPIEVGETATVTATVQGTLNYDKGVDWVIPDNFSQYVSITTLSENVLALEGIAEGTVSLTAKAKGDPSMTASLDVTVTKAYAKGSFIRLGASETAEFSKSDTITDFDGDKTVFAKKNDKLTEDINPYLLYYPVALNKNSKADMTLKIKYSNVAGNVGAGIVVIDNGQPYVMAMCSADKDGLYQRRPEEWKKGGWISGSTLTKMAKDTTYTIKITACKASEYVDLRERLAGKTTTCDEAHDAMGESLVILQIFDETGENVLAEKWVKQGSELFNGITNPEFYLAIGAMQDKSSNTSTTASAVWSDIFVTVNGETKKINSIGEATFKPQTLTLTSSDLKQNYGPNGHILTKVNLVGSALELTKDVENESFTVTSKAPGTAVATIENQAGTVIGTIEFTVADTGDITYKVTPTTAGLQKYVEEPEFEGNYSPANGATDVYEDASLMIKFTTDLEVSTASKKSGATAATPAVRIYRASDDQLIDTIYGFEETITGQASDDANKTINVRNQLITIVGKTAVIKPHKPLANNETYYAKADAGVFNIKGSESAELGGKDVWSFTTRTAPVIDATNKIITIGADKDYSTVQAALDYLADKSGDWTLNVDPGKYHERLSFAGNVNLTLSGNGINDKEHADTEIYWANMNGSAKNKDMDINKKLGVTDNPWNESTRMRSSVLWEGKDLNIRNITFTNTINRAVEGKEGTQAETLYFDSTSKLTVYKSSFRSHQDTLLLGNNGGRAWFYDCYIEGDTDFIWGYIDTALFEKCELRCLDEEYAGKTDKSCYIFASRTVVANSANKGFVLLNCNITSDEGAKVYYGRNSGSDTQATVAFSTFDKVEEKLWGSAATMYDEDISGCATIGYKDYGNVLADSTEIATDKRLADTYTLTKAVAEREYIGRNAVLNRGWDATERKYVAASPQWDISGFETEFNAVADASKSVAYIEPTYVRYIEGGATQTFVATNYKGEALNDLTYTVDAQYGEMAANVFTAKENVTALATITGANDNYSGIAEVNVIPEIIPATSASFKWVSDVKDDTIEVGDTVTLSVNYLPVNLTDSTTEWTTSNSNVARVTGSGAMKDGVTAEVYGFSDGTATITARNKATNTVYVEKTITVKKVYRSKYLQESDTFSAKGVNEHLEESVECTDVMLGFTNSEESNGTITYTDIGYTEATPVWAETGYTVTAAVANKVVKIKDDTTRPWGWAEVKLTARGGKVTLTAIDASMISTSTDSNAPVVECKKNDGEFEKVYVGEKVGKKLCTLKKVPFNAPVVLNDGESATFRVGLGLNNNSFNKTSGQKITIGNVNVYYTPENPQVYEGALGDYNLDVYATEAEKQANFTLMADGTTADGMISWSNLMWHGGDYRNAAQEAKNTVIKIKVGGPVKVSFVGSTWTNDGCTLTVTDSNNNVIVDGLSTKVVNDKVDKVSFNYNGSKDELTLTFKGSGSTYIGTITVEVLDVIFTETDLEITAADIEQAAARSTKIVAVTPDDSGTYVFKSLTNGTATITSKEAGNGNVILTMANGDKATAAISVAADGAIALGDVSYWYNQPVTVSMQALQKKASAESVVDTYIDDISIISGDTVVGAKSVSENKALSVNALTAGTAEIRVTMHDESVSNVSVTVASDGIITPTVTSYLSADDKAHKPTITSPTAATEEETDKGATKSISVTATLTAPDTTSDSALKYQWYKAASADATSGTAVSGATNAAFTVPTTEAGVYYYYAEVTTEKTIGTDTDRATEKSPMFTVKVKDTPVSLSCNVLGLNKIPNSITDVSAQTAFTVENNGESLSANWLYTITAKADGNTESPVEIRFQNEDSETAYADVSVKNGALTVDVTKFAKVLDATWDFQHDYAKDEVNINGASGTVKAKKGTGKKSLELNVDASTGKLTSRGGDAQFNSGAKIYVPATYGSVVTVVSYPNYHHFKVAGTAASDDTTEVTVTSASQLETIGTDTFVVVEATNTAFLYSVSVSKWDPTAEAPAPTYIEAGTHNFIDGEGNLVDYSDSSAGLYASGLSKESKSSVVYAKSSDSASVVMKLSGPAKVEMKETYNGTNGKKVYVTDSDSNKLVDAFKVSDTGYGNWAFIYTGTEPTTLTLTFEGTSYFRSAEVTYEGFATTNSAKSITIDESQSAGEISSSDGWGLLVAKAVPLYVNTDSNSMDATVTWSSADDDALSVSRLNEKVTSANPYAQAKATYKAAADSTTVTVTCGEVSDTFDVKSTAAGTGYALNLFKFAEEPEESDKMKGTSTDSESVEVGDATFSWGSTTGYTTASGINGLFSEVPASTDLNFYNTLRWDSTAKYKAKSVGKEMAYVEFTVQNKTANPVKISSMTANIGNGQTSNAQSYVQVGDSSIAVKNGKDASFSATEFTTEYNAAAADVKSAFTIAANSSVTVRIGIKFYNSDSQKEIDSKGQLYIGNVKLNLETVTG